MINIPSYINNKGKTITLFITDHAARQFAERYRIMNPTVDFPTHLNLIKEEIGKIFNNGATRRLSETGKIRTRRERHGSDSLYFKNNDFTFVVQNATIVTIEISRRGCRDKNKMILNSELELNP